MASPSRSRATILAHHLYDFAECEHRVALDTTPEMATDARGLVHGGFTFGLADGFEIIGFLDFDIDFQEDFFSQLENNKPDPISLDEIKPDPSAIATPASLAASPLLRWPPMRTPPKRWRA